MNDGSDGSDYTNMMSKDAKRLLVDKGFNFVNSTANSQIQKIPFFAQQQLISGGTESDTSFSVKRETWRIQKMTKVISKHLFFSSKICNLQMQKAPPLT